VDHINHTRSPAEEDTATETVILRHLLALHPSQITFEELLREVVSEPDDFAQRDAIERGVRDLVATGLLHRKDQFVVLSRAAVRIEQLLGD
jgi:hypothetical protein